MLQTYLRKISSFSSKNVPRSMLRLIFSSREKNGSKLRLSRGWRRKVGEVTRLVRVLMVDARTYRVIGAVSRVDIEEVRRGRLVLMRGEMEELGSMEEMQERAESCTGQCEESMAIVHRVGNMGLFMVVGREASIEARRLRRETRKLSPALNLNEADDNMGLTSCLDCSAVKRFMVIILLRKTEQAVTMFPL